MLRIACPWCGPRDETEFHYGGEAAVSRPAEPQACSDRQWAEHLFYRDNLRGPQRERWFHQYGCRHWFVLQRDTLDHRWLDGEPPA
jgi:heterotetrameric sarcosine oxidase delta subunit